MKQFFGVEIFIYDYKYCIIYNFYYYLKYVYEIPLFVTKKKT